MIPIQLDCTKLFISESLPKTSKTEALLVAVQSGLKNSNLDDVLCTMEKETSLYIQSHTNMARTYKSVAQGINNIPILANFFKGNVTTEFQTITQIIQHDSSAWVDNEPAQYTYVTWQDDHYFIWNVEYRKIAKRFRLFQKLFGKETHKLSETHLRCSCYQIDR